MLGNRSICRVSAAIIITFCIVMFCPLVFDVSSVYASEAFDTESYKVELTVNEDNTIDVKEVITVDFKMGRHGIFRNIPYRGTIVPKYKGKKYKMEAVMRLKDFDVEGHQFDVSDSNGQKVIKIGDPDSYVEGRQKYVITYKAVIFEDPFKEFDFIYYNILPHNWPTDINKADVKIILPKGVDRKDIKIFSGKYGNRSEGNVKWKAENAANGSMIIKVRADGLEEKEGITLYSILPQGYFEDAANFNLYNWGMIAAAVIMAVLAFFIWFKNGRDPKIIKTVEFYPPDGLDPVQIGYMIDKSVGNKEMVALIIYMANKGYFEIEEIKNEKGKTVDFILSRTNISPTMEKSYVVKLYNSIFNYGETVSYENLSIDFWEEFKNICDEAEGNADMEDLKNYNGKSLKSRILCLLADVLAIGSMIAFACFLSPLGDKAIILGVVFAVLSIGHAILSYIVIDKKDYYSKSKFFVMSVISLGIGASAAILAGIITKIGTQSFVSGIIVGVAQMFIIFFGKYGKALSEEGSRVYGRVLGFKDYIQKAETDRLKMLVEENPDYFYNVLPYAYVLGLSDKWINKFKTISVPPPIWGSDMSGLYMGSFLMYANSRSVSGLGEYQASISDSSDSGVFGGGGGFSGGGFGGGGGGSW